MIWPITIRGMSWAAKARGTYCLMLLTVVLLPRLKPVAAAVFLRDQVGDVTQAKRYQHAVWGIIVADRSTGETLFQENSDQFFAPGSTAKLFSTAVAQEEFGPHYQFVTPVYRTGRLQAHGRLQGNLILRAVGDPNLGGRVDPSGHLTYSNIDHIYARATDAASLPNADPLSGLEDLAVQVAEAGIRQVTDVLVDDRLFDEVSGKGTGPSRVTPIVVNDNVVDVEVIPAAQVGSPAQVYVSPSVPYLQFDCRVRTVDTGAVPWILVREVSPDHFLVKGQIPWDRKPLLRIAEVDDTSRFARALLIERLEDHGIRVERSILAPVARHRLPPIEEYRRMPVVARHVSPPISEAIRVILKVSHNLHANMLPLLVAARNGKRSLKAGLRLEREFLERAEVSPEDVSLADGSGGARSRVTPRAVIALLRAMSRSPNFQFYRDALPILGTDGTLAHAVGHDSPARGKIYAKTGTAFSYGGKRLVMTKAMVGYMTAASGRELVFAIYVRNIPLRWHRDRLGHEQVLAKLAEIFYLNF
jgi:serine-type D-Ala-D-Ala carboxypeptidase/endopeptidase (penicillin-binding protein 4)